MTEQIKLLKERLVEETKDNKNKLSYCGAEVNRENFDFDDLLRMLISQDEMYKRRIEDWKFCVELHKR